MKLFKAFGTSLPPKHAGGIYSSAQTLLKPWEDPLAAQNSERPVQIDIAWLNPATDATPIRRHASQLRGLQALQSDLWWSPRRTHDQIFATVNRTSQLVPDLLFVMDEAGNSRCETAARLAGQQEVFYHSATDGASTQGARRSLTANTTSAPLLGADLVRQAARRDSRSLSSLCFSLFRSLSRTLCASASRSMKSLARSCTVGAKALTKAQMPWREIPRRR